MIRKTLFIVGLTWFFVYVIVTAVLVGFKLTDINLALPVQTFILTALLVPMIMFVIAPRVKRLADRIWG